jgi:hypothetical protein
MLRAVKGWRDVSLADHKTEAHTAIQNTPAAHT